ncbi:MAG: hypothetical protein IKS35_00750 [Clostridia bacterium]|nr:hypothetical protein [Clostridia bacterium]
MSDRMPKDRLVIGAYILQSYAQAESHIRDLAACGLDLIVNLAPKDRSVLDLLSRYGVGAILCGVMPGWWGGNGENAGRLRLTNPPERYREAAARYLDHPAVWGIDIGDEPSALDFPYYGEVAELVSELIPGPVPYLNLYPNYASVAANTHQQTVNQLGTRTYGEHIESYLQNVDLPYLSYDFYLYSLPEENGVRRMLENFRTVSEGCRRTGRAFWYIPQVNSSRQEEFTSADRLRYQGFCALCYGASVINWACYTGGWWYNQVLDENGEKTEQYDKLRAVNAELHAAGDVLAAYRCAGTVPLGYPYEVCPFSRDRLSFGPVQDLSVTEGQWIAGLFEHRERPEKKALLILNASDPYDRTGGSGTVVLRTAEKCSLRIGNGVPEPVESDGRIRACIPVNRALLLGFG